MPSRKAAYREGRRQYTAKGKLKRKLSKLNNDSRSKGKQAHPKSINNLYYQCIYNGHYIHNPSDSYRRLSRNANRDIKIKIKIYFQSDDLRSILENIYNQHFMACFQYENTYYLYTATYRYSYRYSATSFYSIPVNKRSNHALIECKYRGKTNMRLNINLKGLRMNIEKWIKMKHKHCKQKIRSINKKMKQLSEVNVKAVLMVNKYDSKTIIEPIKAYPLREKRDFRYFGKNTKPTKGGFALYHTTTQDKYKLINVRVEMYDIKKRHKFKTVEYVKKDNKTTHLSLFSHSSLEKYSFDESYCVYLDDKMKNKVLFQLSQNVLHDRIGKSMSNVPSWRINRIHFKKDRILPIRLDIFDTLYYFLPQKDIIYGVLMKYLGYDKLQYFIIDGKIVLNRNDTMAIEKQLTLMRDTSILRDEYGEIMLYENVAIDLDSLLYTKYKYTDQRGIFHTEHGYGGVESFII